ncbi:MAG: lipopolysaccharide biosynthesis protein [Pseudomonadota bacterium]
MSTRAHRFTRGLLWLITARWLERVIDLLSLVILARLFVPGDFGLVAIAASVFVIVEGLSALDVSKALIRHRDHDRSLYDTAWTIGFLRGLLVAVVLVLVAHFISDSRIAEIVRAFSLSPLLSGLANPRFVLYERALSYEKPALLALLARLTSFLVTLTVALATRSYWALVLGMLVNTGVSTGLSYLMKPYRPKFTFVRTREIFGFSGWLWLTGVVTTLSMETDKLIVGRLLGVAEAGLYFMTQRIGVLPTRELVSPLQRILFPAFSELVDDPKTLRRVSLESVTGIGTLSLPAAFGSAMIVADLVPLVLGARWSPVAPLLIILVPYLGVRATLAMVMPCILALGRTQLLFAVSSCYAIVHVPAFVMGTWAYGLQGAIWSLVLAGVLYTVLNAWMLWRTLAILPAELLAALRRPALATSGMVFIVLVFRDFYLGLVGPTWFGIASTVAVGAIGYLSLLYWLWRRDGYPEGLERRVHSFLSERF